VSSRANRRAQRGSSRSRRTPAKPVSSGPNIPWIPIAVVVGVLAVVGVIGYLVWQSGQAESDRNEEAQRAEADSSPELPGVWVDLPTIYGAPYDDDAGHVQRDVDYASDCATPSDAATPDDETPDGETPDGETPDAPTAGATATPGATGTATTDGAGEEVCNTNPPVGGPHWGSGSCGDDPSSAPSFCGPAQWGIYLEPWEPEVVVHNMEHGGLVVWYNTTDQDVIDDLSDLVGDKLDPSVGDLIVMMPYPDMEEETIALTGWSRIDKFPVSEYTRERAETFIDAHDRRFNPEMF
jgi:hypothetical protein